MRGSIRAQPALAGFPPHSSVGLRGTGQPAHAGPPRCLCHCDLNHQPSAEFQKQAQGKRDSSSLPRPFRREPQLRGRRGGDPAAHLLGAPQPLLTLRVLDSAPLTEVWCVQCRWAATQRKSTAAAPVCSLHALLAVLCGGTCAEAVTVAFTGNSSGERQESSGPSSPFVVFEGGRPLTAKSPCYTGTHISSLHMKDLVPTRQSPGVRSPP